jgi:hypothetical protein
MWSCVCIVGGVCAQDISIIILHFELESFYADVIIQLCYSNPVFGPPFITYPLF